MTGRNPRYSERHPPKPPARPLPPPRAREPLQPAETKPYGKRLQHYAAQSGTTRLTPAQRRRADAKAHRHANQPARQQAAEAARAARAAEKRRRLDQVLLGRVVQLPPVRWGASAAKALRS